MNKFFLVLAFVLVSAVNALGQAPFYQDKTLRIIAGYGAGSVDDAWTRMIAQYLVKYIPGNPNIVVQNMPGAGAMIAANYVYKVAKPDGLTLGGIRAGLYFDQLVGRKEVQFDWPKFTWLGTPTQVEQIIYIRADTPYKTLDDVRKQRFHQNAAPPVRLRLATMLEISWRKPSEQNSIRSPVTRMVLKSIWPWSEARFNAGASLWKLCSDANRSSAGPRMVLSAC